MEKYPHIQLGPGSLPNKSNPNGPSLFVQL